VQPPSIASSSTTDRELETVFPITTARLLQAYFAAKILVSWLVAIIGPAFRSLWRESGRCPIAARRPNLHNIIGRKAGSLPHHGYSSAMKGADFVWDKEKLDSFIAKPDEVVRGANCVIVLTIGEARRSCRQPLTGRAYRGQSVCATGRSTAQTPADDVQYLNRTLGLRP
jgi:hypothetical protein